MKLVVGLGNPGDEYKNVRHNLGFMVLDELAERGKRKGESWRYEKKFKSEILNFTLDASRFTLVKPRTFMNNSGLAVSVVAKYFKIVPQDIILVYDELDLPLGKIRVRMGGGAAGHHGVESVIEALKTDQFQRVRLGIGPSTVAPDKFVLEQFEISEESKVKKMIKEAVSVIGKIIITQGNNEQTILAVDDNGKFLEYIPKEEGHKGHGKRHLAIAVILENTNGQVLLQKRKHRIFDNIWDITGATHPLHKPHPCHSERSEESSPNMEDLSLIARDDKKCKLCRQDNIDENLDEATRRCLREEWGIRGIEGIKEVGVFNYFASYGDLCENEHCAVMYGLYDGELKLNKEMGYEYKWTDKNRFLKSVNSSPQNYSPWAVKSVQILEKASFCVNR